MSGGGLDYAGLDISNQDFSNGNYKGKDFTQVSASEIEKYLVISRICTNNHI